MLSDKSKQYMLNSFLQTIVPLSDRAEQRRMWLGNRGREARNWDYAIAEFFDYQYILALYRDFCITEREFKLLIELYGRLTMFMEHHTHSYSEELKSSVTRTTEECLALPEWQGIVDLSKKVLQAFNCKHS